MAHGSSGSSPYLYSRGEGDTMGSGSFDGDLFKRASREREERGESAFGYDEKTRGRSPDAWKAHPDLDPVKIKDSVGGVRESCDSAEHPASVPVVVIFDNTGSMRMVPLTFQENLGKLMGILQQRGLNHCQVLVGAVGDETCDHVPFQVGQFESDNRIDDALRNIFIEGGGGPGGGEESYDLAFFFAARLTKMDCLKRGKKGILFLFGDEMPRNVSRRAVKKVFGIDIPQDISIKDIIEEAQKTFDVFFVIPGHTSNANNPRIRNVWNELLDQNVLFLDDPVAVCELIATQIALLEEAGDLEDLVDALVQTGTDRYTADAVTRALAPVAARSGKKAEATGIIRAPGDGATTRGIKRL